jgi:dihydrolipoamide dehydrogenase
MHVLPREPRPLGEALTEVLRRDGIDLALACTHRHDAGRQYFLSSTTRLTLNGDHLLVATGRRPRVNEAIGLETCRHRTEPVHGIKVDRNCRLASDFGDRRDVTGLWQLTHAGKYQGRVVASNILGKASRSEPRGDAAGRLHRSASSVGRKPLMRGSHAQPLAISSMAKTAAYTRDYDNSNGFMTLLWDDGEAPDWRTRSDPKLASGCSSATLAIARVPLDVLLDTIQPFPTFSEIYLNALKALSCAFASSVESIGMRRKATPVAA